MEWKMDKYVCGRCFDDEFVRSFVAENAVSNKCSYCGRQSKERIAADISDVALFIEDGLKSEFDFAVNCLPYESREGGYQGVTYETYELLTDHAELGLENDTLLADLVALLPDELWCDQDPSRLSQDRELRLDWGRFSDLVKHKVRHVFFRVGTSETTSAEDGEKARPYRVLYEIGELLNDLRLSKVVAEGSSLYRARLHCSDRFSRLVDLGPPPKERAIYANRFSPAGIPMFYGAMDTDTVIAEVYDCPNRPRRIASIATFKNTRALRLLDFASLPCCQGIFNGQTRDERAPLRFVHEFVRDCTKGVTKDGREHIEYVPTQVVTEFFRYMLTDQDGKRIDGLLYPSSKREGGICCVVFCTSEDCTEDHQPLKSWDDTREAILSLETQATIYRDLP
jgi:hypothetical protein